MGFVVRISLASSSIANVSSLRHGGVVGNYRKSPTSTKVGGVITPCSEGVLQGICPRFVRHVGNTCNRRIVLSYSDHGFLSFLRGLRNRLMTRNVLKVRPQSLSIVKLVYHLSRRVVLFSLFFGLTGGTLRALKTLPLPSNG